MERVCEPELMNEQEQVAAYAAADFELSHQAIVDAFIKWVGPTGFDGCFLDLGCGPGDVSIRLLGAFAGAKLHGVDGSPRMLACFGEHLERMGFQDRAHLIEGLIGQVQLPQNQYDCIFSSSLLHHLHEPDVLWKTISDSASPGTRVFVADLVRPASTDEVESLVELHAASAPEVLQKDFRASMCAAFRPEEVEQQLHLAGLGLRLRVSPLGDRHMVILGCL